MPKYVTIDGNTAAATISYALNEVIAIYPITPSSVMAELCDAWSAKGKKNIFGVVPNVTEMQHEGGAAGAVHGSLISGALTTTFTASQGLLLMIPNMYKIAGELLPTVFQVSARALSVQALSIFGDHQDVMATRATGFALFASSSIQEVLDFSVVAHMTTLKTRVPILHFFDGFRTSHEIQKVVEIDEDVLQKLISRDLIAKVKLRSLSPDHPTLRGSAQNPDIYFQGREASNLFYQNFADALQESFDEFKKLTGRTYHVFDYVGDKQAEVVMTLMGSGNSTAHETIEFLNRQGYKIGLIKTRLFRPFDIERFNEAIPKTVKRVIVLDRTKESGSNGEPLYLDVVNALKERKEIDVYGGRYGLSSKEFTPSMIKAVFDHFSLHSQVKPIHGFTVGINDDVTHLSIDVQETIDTEHPETYRAKFIGLGSDGTVGASKSTIKILGELTDHYVQGYFVYDSKKAGAVTVSHLRYSQTPIHSAYLIDKPNFVSINQSHFVEQLNPLEGIQDGGLVLLNTWHTKEAVFQELPRDFQQTLIDKKLKLYIIDAHSIADQIGLRGRINMVMQAAFFKITNIIPREKFLSVLESSIKKTYGKKGDAIVKMNIEALHRGLDEVVEVVLPQKTTKAKEQPKTIQMDVPAFIKEMVQPIMQQMGDKLPVSVMPVDGVFETGGAAYEKRAIATHLPTWIGSGLANSRVCIQCNLCAFVCPHAAIRPGIINEEDMKKAPQDYEVMSIKSPSGKDYSYRIQLYPEDCTGCEACVQVCPGVEKDPETKQATGRKALTMVKAQEIMEKEKIYLNFFESIQEMPAEFISDKSVKAVEYAAPYFEFSSACAGCGETPYIKLLTQLYGDWLYVANATGCSSIYGGTAPAVPYCKDENGKGPAWASSLFEDNAEFGLGMKLAINHNKKMVYQAVESLAQSKDSSVSELATDLLNYQKSNDPKQIGEIRSKVFSLNEAVSKHAAELTSQLGKETLDTFTELKDYIVPKTVWIIGGDGWAYDIGFGGLDHVLASGENVNILVLDTQVYSNTGGQNSKATPLGAIAKFASSGKDIHGKKLASHAMSYNHVYVAQIAYGANPAQTLKAFTEAQSYEGPSIILAYSPCIEHGIDMNRTGDAMKKAVDSGFWPLFRFDPRKLAQGESPLKIDSKEAKIDLKDFMLSENRFRSLHQANPERFDRLVEIAKSDLNLYWRYLKIMESEFKVEKADH